MTTNFINEDRLFNLLPNFFEKPEAVMYELLQNSQRASATKVDIELKDNTLIVSDNGTGTFDLKDLLILSETGWNSEIIASQNPAGWGIFFLIAISKQVTFKSFFGQITINCNDFFKKRNYRENIFNLIDKKTKNKGFSVSAVLNKESKNSIEAFLDSDSKSLGLFPMNITLNNQLVERINLKNLIPDYQEVIETNFKGNKLYIALGNRYGDYSRLSNIFINFYGQLIKTTNHLALFQSYYDIKTDMPLTPVLPYRTAIKENNLLTEFNEFLIDTVSTYCIKKINSLDITKNNEEKIMKYIRILERTNFQCIEQLNKYYYTRTQPYFRDNYDSHTKDSVLYSKEDTIEISNLIFLLDNKEIDDTYNIVLPEDAYWEIEDQKFPSWTKLRNKKEVIKIEILEEAYIGNFNWKKSKITSNLNINIISNIEFWGDGDIFFSSSPSDFKDIIYPAFYNVYCENYNFESECDIFYTHFQEDVQDMNNSYNKMEVFSSLKKVKNLDIDNLKSISFRQDKAVFELNTNEIFEINLI